MKGANIFSVDDDGVRGLGDDLSLAAALTVGNETTAITEKIEALCKVLDKAMQRAFIDKDRRHSYQWHIAVADSAFANGISENVGEGLGKLVGSDINGFVSCLQEVGVIAALLNSSNTVLAESLEKDAPLEFHWERVSARVKQTLGKIRTAAYKEALKKTPTGEKN